MMAANKRTVKLIKEQQGKLGKIIIQMRKTLMNIIKWVTKHITTQTTTQK